MADFCAEALCGVSEKGGASARVLAAAEIPGLTLQRRDPQALCSEGTFRWEPWPLSIGFGLRRSTALCYFPAMEFWLPIDL